jgi:hypothetical protein
MKYLKLFEGWSDQYLHDFTDEEKFTIEEDGKKVKGEYRGYFDTADMTNAFADAISKMSADYRILKAQSFFNQVTGNAKFEIEVLNYEGELEHIEIDVLDQKVKWIPEKIIHIYKRGFRLIDNNGNTTETFVMLAGLNIDGRLENGSKKAICLFFSPSDDIRVGPGLNEFTEIPTTKDKITIGYMLGQRARGISINSENFKKLLQLITENKVNFGAYSNPSYQVDVQKMIEMLTLISN